MMRLSHAAIVLLGAWAGSAHATSLTKKELALIERCRSAAPGVAGNPSATGGWLIDRLGDDSFLCLYGSGDWNHLDRLFEQLNSQPIGLVGVRSTGGPVATWLSIAERLTDSIHTIVVDEACFSSCANYIIPLGRRVVATSNSLVVWHGGPTDPMIASINAEVDRIEELIRNDELLQRTVDFYDHHGIWPTILDDTGSLPEAKARELRSSKELSSFVDVSQVTIAGYALSPDRLERCYGFTNVKSMWHAGDDLDVLNLSTSRSADLIILESPFGNRHACN